MNVEAIILTLIVVVTNAFVLAHSIRLIARNIAELGKTLTNEHEYQYLSQIAALSGKIIHLEESLEASDANNAVVENQINEAQKKIASLSSERDALLLRHSNLLDEAAKLRAENKWYHEKGL